ncbi:MAG: HD domain-containing protein [Chitinophaga sp.]|uniref:HD domain-containing protein n=1 Tax=Chitinophaga sp. TaxID=1869181 RepID=UPI001B165D1B|nr:HD domain-containing protein [Chitinophaga sp.]MBO9729548.1 HD domain-containing protein [Chitinophaga sp.]
MQTQLPSHLPAMLALPEDHISREALQFVKKHESPALYHHSIRSFIFARLYAVHKGLHREPDYKENLLFLSCLFHDMGLTDIGNGPQRFEVEGADQALLFLADTPCSHQDADIIWQAIALHTSSGIAERRGTIPLLTRMGIVMDFGGPLTAFVTDEQANAIFTAWPRLSLATHITDCIVGQCRANPAKAHRYAIAGELLRERSTGNGTTQLEENTIHGRWGN